MADLALSDYRRLVVKVGSSLLVDDAGRLNRQWLETLADDIAHLQAHKHEMLIVSSGAIAIGSSVLGINKKRARLEDLQAAAAAGQVQLVHAYQEVLGKHGITAAQILLTPDDTENRRRFLNARGTLGRLLDQSVIPIINENDTVATEEIRYGDNDRLAGRVAQLVMADALILLSDVDGFYTADPGTDPDATHIPEVRAISAEMLAMAGETRSDIGSGGMATKVQAARIATHAGCSTIIASGVIEHPLRALSANARCTIFRAEGTPATARKQWLAGVLEVRGEVRIDQGAAQALHSGNSLLPVGVVEVIGNFRRGDVVTVVGPNGKELGRGLTEYSDTDALRLRGCQSDKIEERLGYRGRSVMIHRDELVLFDSDR
ncbi:MAG: glutamate 5-kinase [Gammaproteobacteria bacterium]|nr:glutamate 5-kinase [Gammaproteobacteria bacterium]MBU2675932.1 glutamate 5-kinase [Gammaproteobacteria bacterium]NNC56719.1 glutamate 5-kinase [Woeseiaceae bacterium]NNL49668.1 glutamate 5-kinase [Woeseiaceae bacterium]